MAAPVVVVEEIKRKPKKDEKPVRAIKTPVDLQRLKLEKLMNNPTKEVVIPEKSKEKNPRAPLEFIRNIWGSSAGAGSGDFHVYRGVRRREYARQKFIKEKGAKEELDEAYQKKLEQNRIEAEARTAKNKAKRLKKKKWKAKKKMKGNNGQAKQTSEQSGSEDSDKDEVEGEGKDDDGEEEDRAPNTGGADGKAQGSEGPSSDPDAS
ncbi:hypothetical protein EGW08_001566 [Elysia chlorotica]|uniref:PRKR-interacting protein 1 homolog n=1 Tax=Elysia chlorotica TaxID=188477 RepID=A0A433UA64_ELYCH|nr:hypothetical protein EGW08_001566 [Elysia chlorotica]